MVRTFYIFKITPEFKVMTKNKPYNLFLALDNIHSLNHKELSLAIKLYNEVCDRNDVPKVNMSIFNLLVDSDFYTKFNNVHLINNYYTDESSKLTVYKTYLKLKTSLNNSSFFETLKFIPNLFVVDFGSKDYFWLS